MKKHASWFLVLALAVSAGGCAGEAKEAMQFHAALKRGDQRLFEAGKAFGFELGQFVSGANQNAAAMRRNLDEADKVLAEVKQEVASLKVPAKPSARKLYEAYQTYLRGQDDGLRECRTLLAELEKGKRGNLNTVLQRLKQSADQDKAALNAAEKEFGQEYNLQKVN